MSRIATSMPAPRRPPEGAQRSHCAGAQSACRHRHAGRARGFGPGGRILGAAAGQLSRSAAQGADHVAKLCRDGAVSQLSHRARERESLGRGVEHVRHQRALALLFLPACQRSHRSGRRQPQRYGPYADLRSHRLGQDGIHRLFDRHAGPSGRDSSHFRQGSRTRNPGSGVGGRISALEERSSHGLQPPAVADHAGQRGISQGLAAASSAPDRSRRGAPSRCAKRPIWIRRCEALWRWSPRRGACRGWSNFSIRPTRRACMRGSRAGARCAAGTTPGCSTTRATPWCRDCRGRSIIGFDVTEFLDHSLTRSPITLYLFHLVRQLLDGRRFVCWMDEFWRLLADPAFENFAKDGPKTWRKLNGVMCLATQSPSDVLDSPISRTLVEQTPTKIFFPNADADFRGVHAGVRADRTRIQAHQRRARAGFAHVLDQAGASQRGVPARSEGF